jgi:hypothetical protein
MEEEQALPKRKPGGQAGNLNAVKHGIYTRWYRQLENAELDELAEKDLHEEISMMRVLLQRLFEMISQESPDLETMTKALTALGKGSDHLSKLLRIDKELVKESQETPGGMFKALSIALKDIER